ncbi:hypothetical protein [Halobacillus naozhouensis]|uniref:DUF3828 domain-containing protein n=1 Tax=Halobacillus naozhouensis TaxID=554880 RepID=A0ABY8J0K1_9BACI|nr:hypothetical protein [Halobacillus naozhouensis]WFT76022.1 hypothetical protein P9989_06570 [Halobacillus naozhouensis]
MKALLLGVLTLSVFPLASVDNSEGHSTEDALTKSEAKQVLTDYEEALKHAIEVTSDENQNNDYHSIEEMEKYLQTYMSADMAEAFTDRFFKETNGKVTVIPQDGPVTFNHSDPISLMQTEKEEFRVTQEQRSELSCHVKMTFTLQFDGEDWIIQDMKTDRLRA